VSTYIASPNGRIQRSGGAGGEGIDDGCRAGSRAAPFIGSGSCWHYGATGRCGGIGTARLSNRARHGHDGRRAGPCFSMSCLGQMAMYRFL
jgi:hypothetical protein